MIGKKIKVSDIINRGIFHIKREREFDHKCCTSHFLEKTVEKSKIITKLLLLNRTSVFRDIDIVT